MDTAVTKAKEDVAISLAKNVVRTKYADIPAEALEIAKKQVLDALAVTIGGSKEIGAKEVVELVQEWGGKGESTLWNYGSKVPAPWAALANGTMCDALDYDDTNDLSGVHSSTTVIPAALAVSERKGGVSGREFLTAVVLGVDLAHRMGYAIKGLTDPDLGVWNGWELTPLNGYFGAAAASGKILGLNEEQMINALGIAYAQASGNFQAIYESAMTKRLQPGLAAKGGVLAALMAEKGITGAQNSLEGRAGLFKTYHRGEYDPDVLTANLGKRFEVVTTCFKAYPICRCAHTSIDATLALAREHSLKPDDVAEVTVFVGEITRYVVCEPLEAKRNPKTIVDTQFNIPWGVATALVHGKPRIGHFTAEAIKDATVLEMARRITPKVDDNLTGVRTVEPAIVEIKTVDGRTLSQRVDYPTGNPENPMSFEAIADKLWECAPLAAKPIPKENLEKVIEMVSRLEQLDDISSILQPLG